MKVRWPEQAAAFAELRQRPQDLRRDLGCTYGRAHALVRGTACLRGSELALLQHTRPVLCAALLRRFSPDDVRRRQVELRLDDND